MDIIEISHYTTPLTFHFGYEAKYQRFCGCYFTKTMQVTTIPEEKHVITNITYSPDELYKTVDGNVGNCWIVTVYNSEKYLCYNYYIRNWVDIVHYYKELDFQFVELK